MDSNQILPAAVEGSYQCKIEHLLTPNVTKPELLYWHCTLKGVFSDFMIDASKNTNDPLIPKMVSFFQNSTSGQRGSLSGMIKTSQTTSISSQTKSKKPLNPHLYLSNHIAYLLNHICNLSNHITYLSDQIIPLPNQIILLSNHIMIWFGRFSGCRKYSRSYRK